MMQDHRIASWEAGRSWPYYHGCQIYSILPSLSSTDIANFVAYIYTYDANKLLTIDISANTVKALKT